MRAVRRPLVAVTAVAVLLGLVGCSGGSDGADSVKGGVLTGIDSVSAADRLTTTVRLDTTPAELKTLAEANGGSGIDASTAAAIAGASIVIERVKRSGGSDLDVQAIGNGDALIELRAVGDTLYLQGDVRGILDLVNKPKVYANLRTQVKSMPSFVQAAVAGQWVSLPASTLTSLSNLAGGAASTAPSKGPRLLADLRRSIDRHATVTKSGTDSRGDHYVLHADARALAADLRASIGAAVPGGSLIAQRIPTDVAKQDVQFDAWVRGGALSELTIDVLQFAGDDVPAGQSLPLTITFVKSGDDISTPADVTAVDLTQLGTLVGALTGGG
jgi:hypothetical protein